MISDTLIGRVSDATTRSQPRSAQVVVIGAGPAGLLLAHLLHRQGITVVVLEQRSRAHVEGRVRAGVLERGTVAVLRELGLDERLRRECLVHSGTKLSIDGRLFRIDLQQRAGAAVTVYGQQEITKDLFDAAAIRGLPIIFEAQDVALNDIDTEHPVGRLPDSGRSPHDSLRVHRRLRWFPW